MSCALYRKERQVLWEQECGTFASITSYRGKVEAPHIYAYRMIVRADFGDELNGFKVGAVNVRR